MGAKTRMKDSENPRYRKGIKIWRPKWWRTCGCCGCYCSCLLSFCLLCLDTTLIKWEPGLDDAADVVAAALHINLHRHHHHHHYHYGLPCFDDAADVVAAALHIDLQLLRVTVFRKQGHRGGGNLTVPLKEWSVALYPVLKIIWNNGPMSQFKKAKIFKIIITILTSRGQKSSQQ